MRDTIKDLQAFLQRSASGDHDEDPDMKCCDEMADLSRRAFESDDEASKAHFRKLTCIRIIALLQDSARKTVAEIADIKDLLGEPLSELKDVKLTLAIARELRNESFSIGQLIAHVLGFSSLEQISASLKQVYGEGLIDALRPYFKRRPQSSAAWATDDELIAAIHTLIPTLFTHRNILCHEMAIDYDVPSKDIIEGTFVVIDIVAAFVKLRAELILKLFQEKGIRRGYLARAHQARAAS